MKEKNIIIPAHLQTREERHKYLRAVNRMKEIKGFYTHLSVYLIVNLFIIVARWIKHEHQDFHFGSLPVLWGIVVLIHAATVYLPGFFLGKNWEEEKIKKLMKEYESDTSKP